MISNFSIDLAINIYSDLQAIFIVNEDKGLTLLGVEITFFIYLGLILFVVVELTNKVESSSHIAFSVTTELSSCSLLSDINSFKSSCKLVLVKNLPLQERG